MAPHQCHHGSHWFYISTAGLEHISRVFIFLSEVAKLKSFVLSRVLWPGLCVALFYARCAWSSCCSCCLSGNGSGHGQGVGSPQNLILRAHGGGWPGVLPLSALPGESLTPPDALSPLMHLFKYWVIVFSFWQRRTRAFNRSFIFSPCSSLAVTCH